MVVPAPDVADPPAATDLRRQVFGFLPYWELSDSSTRLDYQLLSTVAYFGVGADADGDLRKRDRDGSISVGWAGWTSSRMTSVIRAAHKRRTRVVLTVQSFAWTSSQADTQSALLGSAAARQRLARQIAAAVRDRGADGVNLDFEPLVSGRADEFVALVRSVRAALDKVHKGYQVTFDTTGSIGNYPIEAATAPGGADAIFIMGYDYRTASASSAGSIAPLGGPGYDLVDTILAFTDRVSPSKLILGLPYYGRAWSTTSNKPRAATRTGAKYGWSSSVTYANAVALAKKHHRRYDRRDASAWFAYKRRNCTATYGCVTTWREVYYDDVQSLRAKYDTINRYGLRGAGIWALGYEDARPELAKVIVAKFLHDTTPPETGIDVLPAHQGDEGFVVGWSALDMNPIRDYDVQVSIDGGPWRAWLTRTKATQAVWLGRSAHAYAFRARATDAKGNRGTWDIASLPSPRPTLHKGGFATVRTGSLTVRSRPDTSSGAVSQLERGDVVAITGGPVAADGYTWFKISGPLRSWGPTEPVRTGVWVAGRNGSTTYLTPRTPPNTTIVAAGIAGLTFGAGGSGSVGSSEAAKAARAFSPNGDTSEDRLTLRWTNALAFDSLTLRVFRPTGTLLGTRAVTATGAGAQAWAWDGAIGGHRLADGRYLVQLVGRADGHTYTAPFRPLLAAQVAAYAVTIDTLRPKLTSAAIGGHLVSPLRDGRHDAVAVSGAASGATRWRLTVAGSSGPSPGAVIRTIAGRGGRPRTSWDGRTDAASPARDGRYRVTLAVLDAAGNFATRSWTVVVDGTAPPTSVSTEPASISPDGDGAADTAVIRWAAAEPAKVTTRIYRGTRLVRTYAGGGTSKAGAFRWDGRTRAKTRLADGIYRAVLTAQDAAGNRRATTVTIRLDRTAGWLRWAPTAFYPQDGDRLARTSRATFKLARAARTSLTIVDAGGHVVRTAWTDRKRAAGTVRWRWDGRAAGGAMVAPGTYALVLSARSGYGTTVLRRTIVVDAFAISLSSTKPRAGRPLVVSFRSTEPLSSRPVVTLDQTGRPPVRKIATRVGPDRFTVRFVVAAGRGPATITVSATDGAGQRNASTSRLTVR